MQIDSICDESMCPWMIISTRNNYDCHPKSSTPDSFWEDGLPGSLREPGRESLEGFRRVCLIQAQRSESLVPCQAFQLKKNTAVRVHFMFRKTCTPKRVHIYTFSERYLNYKSKKTMCKRRYSKPTFDTCVLRKHNEKIPEKNFRQKINAKIGEPLGEPAKNRVLKSKNHEKNFWRLWGRGYP